MADLQAGVDSLLGTPKKRRKKDELAPVFDAGGMARGHAVGEAAPAVVSPTRPLKTGPIKAGVQNYIPAPGTVADLDPAIVADIEDQINGVMDNTLKNLTFAHHEVFGTWPDYTLTADILQSGEVEFNTVQEAIAFFTNVKNAFSGSGKGWQLDESVSAFGLEDKRKKAGWTAETDVLDPEMLASFNPKSVDDFFRGPYLKRTVDGQTQKFRDGAMRLDEMLVALPRQWAISQLGDSLTRRASYRNPDRNEDEALMLELNQFLGSRVPKELAPAPNAVWQKKTEDALRLLQMQRAAALFAASNGQDAESGGFLEANGFHDIVNDINEVLRLKVDPTGVADEQRRAWITEWYVNSRNPGVTANKAMHELVDLNIDMASREAQKAVGSDHLRGYAGAISGWFGSVPILNQLDDAVSAAVKSDEFQAATRFAAPFASAMATILKPTIAYPVEAFDWAYQQFDKYTDAFLLSVRNSENSVLATTIKTGIGVALGPYGFIGGVILPNPMMSQRGTDMKGPEVSGYHSVLAEWGTILHNALKGDVAWVGDFTENWGELMKRREEGLGDVDYTDEILNEMGLSTLEHPELAFIFEFTFDTFRDLGVAKVAGLASSAIRGTETYIALRDTTVSTFHQVTVADTGLKVFNRAKNEDDFVGKFVGVFGAHPDDAKRLYADLKQAKDFGTDELGMQKIARLAINGDKDLGIKGFATKGKKGALDADQWDIAYRLREKAIVDKTSILYRGKHHQLSKMVERMFPDRNIVHTEEKLVENMRRIGFRYRRYFKDTPQDLFFLKNRLIPDLLYDKPSAARAMEEAEDVFDVADIMAGVYADSAFWARRQLKRGYIQTQARLMDKAMDPKNFDPALWAASRSRINAALEKFEPSAEDLDSLVARRRIDLMDNAEGNLSLYFLVRAADKKFAAKFRRKHPDEYATWHEAARAVWGDELPDDFVPLGAEFRRWLEPQRGSGPMKLYHGERSITSNPDAAGLVGRAAEENQPLYMQRPGVDPRDVPDNYFFEQSIARDYNEIDPMLRAYATVMFGDPTLSIKGIEQVYHDLGMLSPLELRHLTARMTEMDTILDKIRTRSLLALKKVKEHKLTVQEKELLIERYDTEINELKQKLANIAEKNPKKAEQKAKAIEKDITQKRKEKTQVQVEILKDQAKELEEAQAVHTAAVKEEQAAAVEADRLDKQATTLDIDMNEQQRLVREAIAEGKLPSALDFVERIKPLFDNLEAHTKAIHDDAVQRYEAQVIAIRQNLRDARIAQAVLRESSNNVERAVAQQALVDIKEKVRSQMIWRRVLLDERRVAEQHWRDAAHRIALAENYAIDPPKGVVRPRITFTTEEPFVAETARTVTTKKGETVTLPAGRLVEGLAGPAEIAGVIDTEALMPPGHVIEEFLEAVSRPGRKGDEFISANAGLEVLVAHYMRELFGIEVTKQVEAPIALGEAVTRKLTKKDIVPPLEGVRPDGRPVLPRTVKTEPAPAPVSREQQIKDNIEELLEARAHVQQTMDTLATQATDDYRRLLDLRRLIAETPEEMVGAADLEEWLLERISLAWARHNRYKNRIAAFDDVIEVNTRALETGKTYAAPVVDRRVGDLPRPVQPAASPEDVAALAEKVGSLEVRTGEYPGRLKGERRPQDQMDELEGEAEQLAYETAGAARQPGEKIGPKGRILDIGELDVEYLDPNIAVYEDLIRIAAYAWERGGLTIRIPRNRLWEEVDKQWATLDDIPTVGREVATPAPNVEAYMTLGTGDIKWARKLVGLEDAQKKLAAAKPEDKETLENLVAAKEKQAQAIAYGTWVQGRDLPIAYSRDRWGRIPRNEGEIETGQSWTIDTLDTQLAKEDPAKGARRLLEDIGLVAPVTPRRGPAAVGKARPITRPGQPPVRKYTTPYRTRRDSILGPEIEGPVPGTSGTKIFQLRSSRELDLELDRRIANRAAVAQKKKHELPLLTETGDIGTPLGSPQIIRLPGLKAGTTEWGTVQRRELKEKLLQLFRLAGLTDEHAIQVYKSLHRELTMKKRAQQVADLETTLAKVLGRIVDWGVDMFPPTTSDLPELTTLRAQLRNAHRAPYVPVFQTGASLRVKLKSPKRLLPEIIAKDQAKSDRASKFIGFGTRGSSTEAYRRAWERVGRANSGVYTPADIVFVSASGTSKGNVPKLLQDLIDDGTIAELDKAIAAGAEIVQDPQVITVKAAIQKGKKKGQMRTRNLGRNTKYNTGEQIVAKYLADHGYVEVGTSGRWLPRGRAAVPEAPRPVPTPAAAPVPAAVPFTTTATTSRRKAYKSVVERKHPLLTEQGRNDVEIVDAKNGKVIATGYARVVYGDRGPYIEIDPSQLVTGQGRKMKKRGGRTYYDIVYDETGAIDGKGTNHIYLQKRTVQYADYKPGMAYLSPDLVQVRAKAAAQAAPAPTPVATTTEPLKVYSSEPGVGGLLSNFARSPVELAGMKFPTVEHAYQTAKIITILGEDAGKEFAKRVAKMTPAKAKQEATRTLKAAGRTANVNSWNTASLHVMKSLLEQKFKDPRMRQALLETGDRELVHSGQYTDSYWGLGRAGKGYNMHGQILMDIRDRLRKSEPAAPRVAAPVVKNHKMYYKMAAKENVTGKATTTVALSEAGLRTSTTRSYALGQPGDIITFEGRPQRYVVERVYQIKEGDLANPKFLERLSETEGWTVEAITTRHKGQIKTGAWITRYKKLGDEVVETPVFDDDLLALAKKHGIEITPGMTEKEVLHAFEAKLGVGGLARELIRAGKLKTHDLSEIKPGEKIFIDDTTEGRKLAEEVAMTRPLEVINADIAKVDAEGLSVRKMIEDAEKPAPVPPTPTMASAAMRSEMVAQHDREYYYIIEEISESIRPGMEAVSDVYGKDIGQVLGMWWADIQRHSRSNYEWLERIRKSLFDGDTPVIPREFLGFGEDEAQSLRSFAVEVYEKHILEIEQLNARRAAIVKGEIGPADIIEQEIRDIDDQLQELGITRAEERWEGDEPDWEVEELDEINKQIEVNKKRAYQDFTKEEITEYNKLIARKKELEAEIAKRPKSDEDLLIERRTELEAQLEQLKQPPEAAAGPADEMLASLRRMVAQGEDELRVFDETGVPPHPSLNTRELIVARLEKNRETLQKVEAGLAAQAPDTAPLKARLEELRKKRKDLTDERKQAQKQAQKPAKPVAREEREYIPSGEDYPGGMPIEEDEFGPVGIPDERRGPAPEAPPATWEPLPPEEMPDMTPVPVEDAKAPRAPVPAERHVVSSEVGAKMPIEEVREQTRPPMSPKERKLRNDRDKVIGERGAARQKWFQAEKRRKAAQLEVRKKWREYKAAEAAVKKSTVEVMSEEELKTIRTVINWMSPELTRRVETKQIGLELEEIERVMWALEFQPELVLEWSPQPSRVWQLQMYSRSSYNDAKVAKFMAGGMVKKMEMFNSRKFLFGRSLDDFTTMYKTFVMMKISTMLRIPLADEFVRLFTEGIHPMEALREAKALRAIDKLPQDIQYKLSELIRTSIDGPMAIIPHNHPRAWLAYQHVLLNDRNDPTFARYLAGKTLLARRKDEMVRQVDAYVFEANSPYPNLQSLINDYRNLWIERGDDAFLFKAWYMMGYEKNGGLRRLGIDTHRIMRLGDEPGDVTMQTFMNEERQAESFAASEGRWTAQDELSTPVTEKGVDQFADSRNLIDNLVRWYDWWYDHEYLGPDWHLAKQLTDDDLVRMGVLGSGEGVMELPPGTRFMTDYTKRMGVPSRENWDKLVKALNNPTIKTQPDKVAALYPPLQIRTNGTSLDGIPVVHQVRDAFYGILDWGGSRMNEMVYAHVFTRERDEALAAIGKTLDNVSASEIAEIEKRAAFHAREYLHRVMFNNATYMGEDMLRNILLFLPAYRQFVQYWVPYLATHPFALTMAYRLNRDKEQLQNMQVGPLSFDLARMSFLINQGDNRYTGWLPSGAPLISLPVSALAMRGEGDEKSVWGNLAGHWPFDFAGSYMPLNSPVDKVIYGIFGVTLPWPLGSDHERNPWRELQFVRNAAMKGEEMSASEAHFQNRMRRLFEGGWNFVVPIGMRVNDKGVEQMVEARREWNASKSPKDLEKVLSQSGNETFKTFIKWQNLPSYEQLKFLKEHPEIVPYMVSGFEGRVTNDTKTALIWSDLRELGSPDPALYTRRLEGKYEMIQKIIDAGDARAAYKAEEKWWERFSAMKGESHEYARLSWEWENSEGTFAPGGVQYAQGHFGRAYHMELLNGKFAGIGDPFTGISSTDSDAYRLAKLLDTLGGEGKKLLQMSPNYEMYVLLKLDENMENNKDLLSSYRERRMATRMSREKILEAGYSQAETEQIQRAVRSIDNLWNQADKIVAKFPDGYIGSEGREIRKQAITLQNQLIASSPLLEEFLGDNVAALYERSFLTKPAWKREDLVRLDDMDETERDMVYHLMEEKDPLTGAARWNGLYMPEKEKRWIDGAKVIGYVPVDGGWRTKIQMGEVVGTVQGKVPKEAGDIELIFTKVYEMMKNAFDATPDEIAANAAWYAKMRKSLPRWAEELVEDGIRAEAWRFWLDAATMERHNLRTTVNPYYSDAQGFSLSSKYGLRVKKNLLRYAKWLGQVTPAFRREFAQYNANNEMLNSILGWYL